MLVKIIDSLIRVLNNLRNGLIPKVPVENEHKSAGSDMVALKKKRRPKGKKTSHVLKHNSSGQKLPIAALKVAKGMKHRPKETKNTQNTLKKAARVDKLIKGKKMTIAEACKKVGLAPSYYYKIRKKN